MAIGHPSVVTAASPAPPADDRRRIARLFSRAAFGATVAEIDQWAARGYQAAVDSLLSFAPAATRPDDAEVTIEALSASAADSSFRTQWLVLLPRAQRWWLDRMATTSYPLEEKLTLFWHGHFTSGVNKVGRLSWVLLQNQLLRDHAAGNFRAFCKAVTANAAMLIYLDGASNQVHAPNENYGREFMELFTLGHNQGYTQADVREAARALTGYTVDRNGTVQFVSARHDPGVKTILSNTGPWGPLDVTDLVLDRHPQGPVAAGYVATRLATFLHHPNPEPAVVAAMAGAFVASGYEIKPMVRTLLMRPEFMDGALRTIKSPAELVAGTVRSLNLATDGALERQTASAAQGRGQDQLALLCDEMGQTLFEPPNVSGWRGGAAWANTATMLARYNFAALVASLVTGDALASVVDQAGGNPEQITAAWMGQLGLLELSASTSAGISQYLDSARRAHDSLGTVARGLLTLLIASPDYNLR